MPWSLFRQSLSKFRLKISFKKLLDWWFYIRGTNISLCRCLKWRQLQNTVLPLNAPSSLSFFPFVYFFFCMSLSIFIPHDLMWEPAQRIIMNIIGFLLFVKTKLGILKWSLQISLSWKRHFSYMYLYIVWCKDEFRYEKRKEYRDIEKLRYIEYWIMMFEGGW